MKKKATRRRKKKWAWPKFSVRIVEEKGINFIEIGFSRQQKSRWRIRVTI